MTESEWMKCTDPALMLDHLEGKVSDRKLLLFIVACCKHLWPIFTDERSRKAIETTGLYADGLASKEMLEDATKQAEKAEADETIDKGEGEPTPALVAWEVARQPASYSAQCCGDLQGLGDKNRRGDRSDWWETHVYDGEEEAMFQVHFLRDIVGNPFHPLLFERSWLTSDVVKLAKTIYEKPAFVQMPSLGTALKNAGCTDAAILDHCQGTGPHVRGCWVVDLILGKKS